MFDKVRKGKVRDFCLNVICKLVAKALQVDKLPKEEEEKKGNGGRREERPEVFRGNKHS